MKKPLLTMAPLQAVFLAVIIVAILGVSMISWGWVPQLSLLLVICVLFGLGFIKKVKFEDMQSHMAESVSVAMGAIYLFSFIGLLVSALMMSGAIPTLMYHGFDMLSPEMFYVSAFVLTSVIGIAIGSSLTTCATIGVAFISMAGAFNADLAITAGAIVSGAFFGDKMSPLSDTCSIASSIVGIDLFEHIRNMMYTTVPAWILTAILLWTFSPEASQVQLDKVLALQQQLEASHLINDYALIPLAILVVLAILKVNAIYAIILTIIASLVVTFMHSSPTISQLGTYFFVGYQLPEGVDLGDVGKLLTRGGLNSMFFTQILVILALSLGGLLQALGILPALLDGIRHMLTKASRAVAAAAFTSLGINVLVGEQYLSLLLSGNAFLPEFKRLGLHPRNLSRTVEDAGTVINPLVPWSVCGVFISSVLGVAVIDYLPYAFFCYLSFVLTLFFGFTGLTISRVAPEKQ